MPWPYPVGDARLGVSADRIKAGIEGIERCPGLPRGPWNSHVPLMQIIDAGGADVERAVIANIEIVAEIVIDALVLLPAEVHDAAVVEPIDQSLCAGGDGVVGLGE